MTMPDEFARAVHGDRSRFLLGLTPDVLGACMELDLPHQTLLRFAYEHAADAAVVAAYHASPQFRVSLLRNLQERAHNEEARASTSVEHVFANDYGFAAFSLAGERRRDRFRVALIDDTSRFSTGALEFFTFNLHGWPDTIFEQRPQVTLLAATLFQMIHRGRAEGVAYHPVHDRVFEELRTPALGDLDATAIEDGVCEFLELHEAGHTYRCGDTQPVLDLLHRRGLGPEVMPILDFPTLHQLASWDRIAAGRGSVEDVLFLYGDLVANMTLIASGVCTATLALLRAFNWSIIRPPQPRSRPSGLSSFLVYSSGNRLDEFRRDLGNIIDTALAHPSALAARMQALELRQWDALQSVAKART